MESTSSKTHVLKDGEFVLKCVLNEVGKLDERCEGNGEVIWESYLLVNGTNPRTL